MLVREPQVGAKSGRLFRPQANGSILTNAGAYSLRKWFLFQIPSACIVRQCFAKRANIILQDAPEPLKTTLCFNRDIAADLVVSFHSAI